MKKIPIHKIAEQSGGELARLKHISKESPTPAVDYAHRDDYYIFFFVEKGNVGLSIDFIEYDIKENSVCYILPGQVHLSTAHSPDASVWALIVDSSLVRDEYKEVFERSSLLNSTTEPDATAITGLKNLIPDLERRLSLDKQPVNRSILHDLLSFYIGTIAEIYQKGLPVRANNRAAIITSRFKSLLAANYASVKSPSQYAAELNISPVYLNEAVKATTGLTAGECIRNEIVVRAKRLLFHTSLSVKEIANELGYDDWAYFSRMFSRASGLPPSRFRAEYLK